MKDTNRTAVLKAVTQLIKDYAEFEDERHAHDLSGRIPAREAYVLVERAKGRTLVEVGNDLSVGKERVRQLQAKGARRLKGWLENGGEERDKPTFTPKAALVLHDDGGTDAEARAKELRGKVKELERALDTSRRQLRAKQTEDIPAWRRAVTAEQKLKHAESMQWKAQHDALYADYMERVGALRQEIKELRERLGE